MTITFRAASALAAGSGSQVIISLPTGVQAGDLLIANVPAYYHSGPGASCSAPSGWNTIFAQTGSGGANVQEWWTFYKIAGSSEPSTYTFTTSSGDAGGFVGVIAAWTGIGNLGIDVKSSSVTNSGQVSNPSITIPSITTANAGQLILVSTGRSRSGSTVFSTPSGFTKRSDLINTTIAVETYFADQAFGVGATGSVTQSGDTSGTSSDFGGFLVQIWETSVKNVTTNESGSASDSPDASIIKNASTSESASAVDSSFTGVLVQAIESGNAQDIVDATAVYGVSTSETASSSDSVDGGRLFSLSIAEPIDVVNFGPSLPFYYYEGEDGVESVSSSQASCVFVGGISGNALTIQSIISGSMQTGLVLDGPGVQNYPSVNSGSGTSWTLNSSASSVPLGTTMYAGALKHYAFGYVESPKNIVLRRYGMKVVATDFGSGASGFAQPAFQAQAVQFSATLSGTSLVVSSIAGAVPNSQGTPTFIIGQQIAVGGVTTPGPVTITGLASNPQAPGTYTVSNPSSVSYGSTTSMTASAQGGLNYNGQYWIPTGHGTYYDAGIFSDATIDPLSTSESSVMIWSPYDVPGSKFDLKQFSWGPNPHYAATLAYIRVTGYSGPIPTFDQTTAHLTLNGATLVSDGYTSRNVKSMTDIDPTTLTPIGGANVNFQGITSFVTQAYGKVLGQPDNSPYYEIDYVVIRPNENTADTSTFSYIAGGSVAEVASASDSATNAVVSYGVSTSENGSASDTPSAQLAANVTDNESANAQDTVVSGALYTVSTSETNSAADAPSAGNVTSQSTSEVASASETSTGGAVVTVADNESANAVDAPNVQDIYNVPTIETANASDSSDAAMIFFETLFESTHAVDSPGITAIYSAAMSETASALDLSSVSVAWSVSTVEAGNAVDVVDSKGPVLVNANEQAQAVDYSDAFRFYIGPLSAQWSAGISFNANITNLPPANLVANWSAGVNWNANATAIGNLSVSWSIGSNFIANGSYGQDSTDTYNDSDFRTRFPEYADINQYPYSTLKMYWGIATDFISQQACPCRVLNGDSLKYATYLMQAHLLYLGTQRVQQMLVGAGGTQGGFKTSATIDKVSVQYLAPPMDPGAGYQWWLCQTPYGQQLWALLDILAVGGFAVGGLPERSALRKVGGLFV